MIRTVMAADGRELRLAASALLPRQYRYHYNRDLILDIKRALEASGKSLAEIQASPDAISFDAIDMTVFENLAWLMLRAGGEPVGGSPEEWLAAEEDPLLIYTLLPAVIDLWAANTATTAKPKKK